MHKEMNQEEQAVGYIRLVFLDSQTEEVITIGGAGFVTDSELQAAWDNIQVFKGQSNFLAELLDKELVILEDKEISAETCEALMDKPIAKLIEEGRKNLQKNKSGQTV